MNGDCGRPNNKLPTIAELEAMIEKEGAIEIAPDGVVSVKPCDRPSCAAKDAELKRLRSIDDRAGDINELSKRFGLNIAFEEEVVKYFSHRALKEGKG